MGFWSTLGKIGLKIAPYVAAPFTGGASLALAPLTNAASDAWNQHDANSQGIGPSSGVVNKAAQGMDSPAQGGITGMQKSLSLLSNGSGSMMGQMPGAVDVLGQSNQNNPNLADALAQGRSAGMANSLPRFVNALGQQNKQKQQPMYQ